MLAPISVTIDSLDRDQQNNFISIPPNMIKIFGDNLVYPPIFEAFLSDDLNGHYYSIFFAPNHSNWNYFDFVSF